MRGHSAVLDDRPLLDQPYELRRRKLAELPYLPGKRPDFWAKHPLVQTREVIVCGWRQGQSGFTGTVGGLLLGAHDPDTGELVYIGDIGTGFTRQDRDQLRDRLVPLERRTHPFVVAPRARTSCALGGSRPNSWGSAVPAVHPRRGWAVAAHVVAWAAGGSRAG